MYLFENESKCVSYKNLKERKDFQWFHADTIGETQAIPLSE